MENNIDRKTLSFTKGMTNIPSDLLSDDDELIESDGFIYRDGEMKPIQKPIKIGNIPYEIKYVHKGADYVNLISWSGGILYWHIIGDSNAIVYPSANNELVDISGEELYDVKSVGNTLIASTSNGLYYFLFKAGAYKELGNELPIPNVKFVFLPDSDIVYPLTPCSLKEIVRYEAGRAQYDENGNLSAIVMAGVVTSDETLYYKYSTMETADKQDAFQQAVQGHVAERISNIKENNRFCFPFFVRYALKLFDGTYARISNPILIYPSINRNCKFSPVDFKDDHYVEVPYGEEDGIFGKLKPSTLFSCKIRSSSLGYIATIDNAENWSDIVKEIVVFASDDVMPFYLEDDWKFVSPLGTKEQCYLNFPYRNGSDAVLSELQNEYFSFAREEYPARDVILPNYKSDKDIISELLTKSQFYELFSVDISDSEQIGGFSYKDAPIQRNVVSNLTEQKQLPHDDYYGWAKTQAVKMFEYNKRINLFEIKRLPFDGFSVFSRFVTGPGAETNSDIALYSIYTHIVSENMDRWVKAKDTCLALPEFLDGWFYYPDPNATEMLIVKYGTTKGVLKKLTQHKMLNGAYSFSSLPYPQKAIGDYDFSDVTIPKVDASSLEYFDSQIFTSVVNNPFVFEASGDNTVGTGKIIDIAANTEAVSQGQFGQYPLLVFTSEGIYGLSVNSEGLYSASYPISREVCNDDSPIIPTDKLIFFASKKGLMATSGGAVACMSEQMRGRIARNFSQFVGDSFLKFLKGSVIAYDYRDSLLRIFKPGQTHHYIYNMVDKTFAMVNDGIDVKAAVNNYPDNLIQDKDGNVYSLIDKPDINDDENAYSGSFVTRPLKLGGSLFLKSIRAIKNLVDSDDGSVKLEVWGSNDCKHWQKLNSIYGKPWKYFTFKYNVSGFKATDSFAGSIVEVQTRRPDKMR